MSWYTTCKGEIGWCRRTYNEKYEVENDIKENKEIIERCKQDLAMLAAGHPRDLLHCKDCGDYELDPMNVLSTRLSEIWEEYEDAVIDNYKLNFLLENWDTRDGDFVENPLIPKEPEPDPAQLEFDFDGWQEKFLKNYHPIELKNTSKDDAKDS